MRHRLAGKELSRDTQHRRALRRNMAASLFQHGAIRTTETKAKELRRFVEKLITIARKGTLHARRRVLAELNDRAMADAEGELLDKTVVQKLFGEIAPRYANRPGGYTRIIRLSERRIGDAGTQVLLQLVEEAPAGGEKSSGTSRRRRRATKRHEAAAGAAQAEKAPAETPTEQAEEKGEEKA
ncbi:MAG TPA: 50S ribosomal protein L17 [Phycisphaerales bacterium]|nr:50S ribosomal protein L17 [Phycisphaerales bacterium]